jgi:hypothetical protein
VSFFKATGQGVELACTVASAEIVIPNDYSGAKARYLMIAADTAALVYIHFRIGLTGGTAVVTDTIVPANAVPLLVNVQGLTHVQARTSSSTGLLSLTPIEPA